MSLPKPRVLARVTYKLSPIHGEDRGTYLQAALPNKAQVSFGRRSMSFDPPYRVHESLANGQEDILRALLELDKHYTVQLYAD